MKKDSEHCLTNKNFKKMEVISKFIDIFILKIMSYICIALFCAVYGFFSLLAFVKQEYELSIISILIWFPILSFWSLKVTPIIVFSFSIIFFINFYITLRFRQLFSLMENKNWIHINLDTFILMHNKLAHLTYKANQVFKYIMAFSYFIASMSAVIAFLIFFYGRGIFLFRLAVLIVGSMGVTLIYLITQFSAILSVEAHRFYSSMNSLVCVKQLRFRKNWKVIQ